MARISLLAALALLFWLPAGAQEEKFASSQSSPLERAGVIPPNETTFSGQARISGKFIVLWEQGSEGYPGYFRVLLRPDARSQAILPHDQARGPVRELWIRNTEVALQQLIGPAKVAALQKHKAQQVTGIVTVVIGSYRTSVDCDQRGYNALLLKVVHAPAQVAVSPKAGGGLDGC
jgi:hypothetical protein